MMEFEVFSHIAAEARTVRANSGQILPVKKLCMETTSKGTDFTGTTLGCGQTYVTLVRIDNGFYESRLPSGSVVESACVPPTEVQKIASYLTK